MMRDLIGNKIEPGNLLYCPNTKQVCKVTEVREPTLSNDDPVLVMELSVPLLPGHFSTVAGEKVAVDFIRIMDPNSEALLSNILQ
jgi:hypothetical protein